VPIAITTGSGIFRLSAPDWSRRRSGRHPRRLSSGLRREKHQSTHFDALPRRRVWRRQRILERRVERQSRPPVVGTVVHPDQNDLIGLLLGEIIPTVLGIEFNRGGLTANMRIHQVAGYKVSVGKALRIQSASGESSTGPRIGRQTFTMPNRCFNNSSASMPR